MGDNADADDLVDIYNCNDLAKSNDQIRINEIFEESILTKINETVDSLVCKSNDQFRPC